VRWTWGAIEVFRVLDPDVTLELPPDDATKASLARAGAWLDPYRTADGGLLVGSSATVIRTRSSVVIVDPWLAFDDPARLAPRLAALRAHGVDPAEVDVVINSHVDGVGANTHRAGSPVFENARYLRPAASHEAISELAIDQRPAGTDAFLDLAEAGRLELVEANAKVVPGVWLEDAPGHTPGHVVVWVGNVGQTLVITGHLFLHPAQIARPKVATGDVDPKALEATRRSLLGRCAEANSILVGPLFAPPGGGRVVSKGGRWQLSPAG
jgi:glyoxylase-like metal-dependent hydrolase (beta-lactamase superfamily II)